MWPGTHLGTVSPETSRWRMIPLYFERRGACRCSSGSQSYPFILGLTLSFRSILSPSFFSTFECNMYSALCEKMLSVLIHVPLDLLTSKHCAQACSSDVPANAPAHIETIVIVLLSLKTNSASFLWQCQQSGFTQPNPRLWFIVFLEWDALSFWMSHRGCHLWCESKGARVITATQANRWKEDELYKCLILAQARDASSSRSGSSGSHAELGNPHSHNW